MNKKVKRLIAFFMTIAILMVPIISIYAATEIEPQIISSLKHNRILNLPSKENDDGVSCGALQGMVIGRSHDSLFAAKIDSKETACILYYFPNFNYSDVAASNKHAVISIKNAGHVNGMAIDDKNIYFTGKISGSDEDMKTDHIIKIPRSLISNLANQLWNGTIDKAVINQSDYTELKPKVTNPDASQRKTVPYVDYNRVISNMTCIDVNGVKKNEYFIINYQFPNTSFYGEDYEINRTAFTRAKIMEDDNGKEFLYISESASKVFVVKNTLKAKEGYDNADICYSSKCGFFVPKFYKDKNEDESQTKNVILWADIDGEADSTYTRDGKTYNMYTPDKINLNVKNYQESLNGVTKPLYKKFEIEGMDFDEDLNLYFSANVSYKDDSANDNEDTENTAMPNSTRTVSAIGYDAVFQLVRTDKGSNGKTQDWTLACKPS